jgi:hypothetical protein
MTKRLLSVLLVFVMLVGALSSCKQPEKETDIGELISEADGHLDSQDHTVNITMSFISEDDDMRAALEALDSTSITYAKSGDNINIKLDVVFDNMFVNTSYTVVEDTLYNKIEINATGEIQSLKQRSMLSPAERASVVRDAGAGAVLNHEDFEDVSLEENDSVKIVTCKGIKDESAKTLVDLFKSAYGASTEAVSISDAELVIRLLDGKYNGMYLTCNYAITVSGVTYEVRLQMSREYDYTTPVSISAPEDAAQYTLVPYDTIIE